VDVKDDEAMSFYRHHGFEQFESQPRTLFLPHRDSDASSSADA
jgi:hypothetical protein